MSKNTCTFLATFPTIQTALKVSGDGGGMRIQLDIPETELGEAARLLLMREKILKVTVEVVEQPTNGNRTPRRTAAKKRNG